MAALPQKVDTSCAIVLFISFKEQAMQNRCIVKCFQVTDVCMQGFVSMLRRLSLPHDSSIVNKVLSHNRVIRTIAQIETNK